MTTNCPTARRITDGLSSNMEMRLVYAQTLNELIEENPNVICVEADLSKASGTNPAVIEKHPKNFVNVGVSEANMISVCRGTGQRGEDPLLRQLFLLRLAPGLRPGHHQRGLRQQQREDRRHGPGHHPGPQRRDAHVLPGPGHHARHAQHACLQPLRSLRAAAA